MSGSQPFTQMKKLQVLTHPDQGGSPEAFHIVQVEYQILTTWLKQYKLQVAALSSVWKDEFLCHCLKCSAFFKRRGQCEASMGMTKKRHKAPCGLAAGSFHVRKAYPKFWPEYVKMVAHGMSLQDARREIKKLYELDAFDKKERAKYKRQRQQEEEVKKNAKNMITSRAGGAEQLSHSPESFS